MFIATISTPGYLPNSDSPPPVFDTAQEAWNYLADERIRDEDQADDVYTDGGRLIDRSEYSPTVGELGLLGEPHFWAVNNNPGVCGALDFHLDSGPREPNTPLCGSLSDITVSDVDDVTCPWCTSRAEHYSNLASAGLAPDGTGNVYGPTPGYEGDRDLGLVYSVMSVDHVNYPHEPGRLYDCPACEARCHCVEGTVECVFDGEHEPVPYVSTIGA